MAWFVGIERGLYLARFPVWLIAEEPEEHQFVVAVERSQMGLTPGALPDTLTREYVAAITRRRVHQPAFRARVLHAYEDHCTVCKIHHTPLLDAAHIIPDTESDRYPSVENDLSLCKIHHAAYDADIMGITPDLRVHVREDVLAESDGPMLQHGLKDLHKQPLMWVPRKRAARPSETRLQRRFEQFLAAG